MKRLLSLLLCAAVLTGQAATQLHIHNPAGTAQFAAVYFQKIATGGAVWDSGWNGGAMIAAGAVGEWQGTFTHHEISSGLTGVYRYTVYYGPDSNSGTNTTVVELPWSAADGTGLDAWLGAAPPCETNLTWNVVNNSSTEIGYYFANGRPGVATQDGGSPKVVKSGGTLKHTIRVPCADMDKWKAYRVPPDYDPLANDGSQFQAGYSAPISPTFNTTNSTTSDQISGGVTYDANNTNSSPIIWQAGASTSAALAIQNAANAIQDTSVKAMEQAHRDAKDIESAVKGVSNAVTNIKIPTNAIVFDLTSMTDGMVDIVQSQEKSTVTVSNQLEKLNANLGGAGISNALSSFVMSLTNLNLAKTNSNALTDGALLSISNALTSLGDTNADVATESTLKGMSNLLGEINGRTNGLDVAITNYAQETTLRGISNLLGSARSDTNMTAIDGQATQGNDAAQPGKTALEGYANSLGNVQQGERFGRPTSDWRIEVPYLNVGEINLDPFSLPWVASLAAFIRNFVAWVFAFSLFYRNTQLLIKTINSLFTFRQTTTAGGSIFGNNLNPLSCIIVAGLITVLTLIIPMYFADWFGATGLISLVCSNPASSVHAQGPVVSVSLYIVDQFFPLAFMVWCVLSALLFRAFLAPLLWLVGTVIRFLSGL